jgi:hypothetical protein
MKFGKEYIIPIVIIIVLFAYLIFSGGKNKITYKIPELERIEEDAVTRIEITKAGRKIVLEEFKEGWKIVPQEYPANEDKVTEILAIIRDLSISEQTSKKKNYQRYELDDDKKINVKAFKDDEVLREFDIGKISPTYSHTFIKIADDGNVYSARESFRNDFDVEVEDLRNKDVLAFDKNEISKIEIIGKDETYQFEKKMHTLEKNVKGGPEEEGKEEPKVYKDKEGWLMPEGDVGNESEIESFLSKLSSLTCDSFIEGKSKNDFKEPAFVIFLKGTKDYSLKIYEKQEKNGGKYPAISSESEYPFLLSTYNAEDLMKKKEDFLKKEKNLNK